MGKWDIKRAGEKKRGDAALKYLIIDDNRGGTRDEKDAVHSLFLLSIYIVDTDLHFYFLIVAAAADDFAAAVIAPDFADFLRNGFGCF